MIEYEISIRGIGDPVGEALLCIKSPVRLEIGDKFLLWEEEVKESLATEVQVYLERHRGPLFICDIEYYCNLHDTLAGVIYLSKDESEL